MSRRKCTQDGGLKLTVQAPVRLMGGSLALTVIALAWFAWREIDGLALSAGRAWGPFYTVGIAALCWTVTLSLLRRWRSQDRNEHRRLVEERDRLNLHVAALSSELQQHEKALQETHAAVASLEQTIREYAPEAQRLKTTTEEALFAERKAIEGERAKAEYLARMSRDIRAPLTTILGFTQTLLDMGDLSKAPSDRVEALYIIKQEGQQLLDTIDDTLELCAIELQQCQISPIRCPLVETVSEVHRLMAGWAEARGLRLLVEYGGRVPEFVTTDPERLTQILLNLLGNALKFTLCGDVRLKVALAIDDSESPRLCFEVLDSGIGMHRDQTGRLFGGFARSSSKDDRRRRGSGLGLTISKSYAEMLGGDIVVLDTMPGIGTRIRLSIQIGPIADVRMIEPPTISSRLIDRPDPACPSPSTPATEESVVCST